MPLVKAIWPAELVIDRFTATIHGDRSTRGLSHRRSVPLLSTGPVVKLWLRSVDRDVVILMVK